MERLMLSLGKLKSLGLSAPWQVPLYLPTGYLDCRTVVRDFSTPLYEGQRIVVLGQFGHDLFTEWKRSPRGGKRSPLTRASLLDERGNRIKFSFFGDPRGFEGKIKDRDELCLAGTVAIIGGRPFLNGPILLEASEVGRLLPTYPGRVGVLSSDTVRRLVTERLGESIPLAAMHLRERLGAVVQGARLRELVRCTEWTLEEVLAHVHNPSELEQADEAHEVLARVAALIAVQDLKETCALPEVSRTPLLCEGWESLLTSIPFALTDEQSAGIHHLVSMLQAPSTSVSLINADVGMGKSVVYQAAVAYVARAGGRCAVLLPHERLAEQAFKEIRDIWPELDPVWVNKSVDRDLTNERVLVGTTALLFREIGPIDLFVTDEQHRFSVEQRKALVDQRTHVIEVSATPIPRTQAMLMYGSVNVVRLTKYHSPRHIQTRIVQRDEARVMVQDVKKLLRDPNCRLLIVCPRKDPMEEEGDDVYPLPSVQEVSAKWEALFPGKVRVAHSGADEEENRSALSDVDAGRAQILISTTIVETGVNIRGLRILILLHAERFGVAQTHQLRGRLSRHGGDGWCYLYLPRPVGEKAMARLQAIESTNDGLKLAELDMRTRGVGDLSSVGKRQHGSADSVIFNKTVSAELVAEMLESLASEAAS